MSVSLVKRIPMGVHRLGIRCDDLAAYRTTLTLDGKPLLGVTDLTLHMGAYDVNTVTLEMICWLDADLRAEMERIA